MNRRLPFSRIFNGLIVFGIATAAPFPLFAKSAPGFVSETEAEFQTLADLNGDGHPDLVVVDKASGQFRVANGSADGSLTWRDNPGNSGLPGVTGFSAGSILASDRDALLFAEPFANRIHVVEASADQRLTDPVRINAGLVGPELVTAMNLPAGPGGYDARFLDIVYHAILENNRTDDTVSHLRNARASFPFAEFGNFSAPAGRRPNRIALEAGTIPIYGFLGAAASTTSFNLHTPTVSPMTRLARLTGLPANADYVYADFAINGKAQFVFFAPGSAILHESAWDGAQLTALNQINYAAPVASIRVIDSAGQPELLILHSDGTTASRASYDGAGKISVQENFQSPPGETFSGAASIGNHLHLLSGTPDGRSRSIETYLFSGDSHSPVNEQTLTPLQATDPGASVLLFDKPPLTNPDAVLLSRLHAGPWTSAFSLTSGSADVVSETYRGTTKGLGNHQTISLASAPATTGGGLTNQISPDLSLLFHAAPVGTVGVQLTVEPGSGTYSEAVRPVLAVASGGRSVVRYRTNQSGGWGNYNAANPPIIITDTTFYAVAEGSGGSSNVVKAEYVFSKDPAIQDSNGDGLPDFVAQAFGLDPLAENHDTDGDGFTDFDEILAGSNPRDPASKPSRAEVAFEYPNSFNLVVAPGIPNPADNADLLRSFASGGTNRATRMTVHQPNGFYLGDATTADTTLLSDPAASFSSLSIADSDLFVIATTETNFSVNAAGAKDYGRQAAAIISIPEQDFEPFHYSDFGSHGGYKALEAEAKAWTEAAIFYYQNLERETVVTDPVDPKSTLVLLLAENFLGKRMHARSLTDRANISLTPFRANESPLAPGAAEEPVSDRDRSVALSDLLALQERSASGPSYKIKEIVAAVENAVAIAPAGNIVQLIELANRLYTTSATNTEAGALRQPFDALRRFIRTGALVNTGYDNPPASASFPASLLAAATQGIAEIEALLPERTLETIAVFYDGSPLTDCQTWREVLYTHGAFDPENPILIGPEYTLMDNRGNPFPISRAFPLTAGSVFEVTGFIETANDCGDLALELVSQPDLLFLRNASPADLDGDLIPDSIQALLAGTNLAPFADTDGDGYTDLQEITAGSDPTDASSIPMLNGRPARIVDPTPPQVTINANTPGSATISFNYPAALLPYIEFQLYTSADLQSFAPTGLKPATTSTGHHTLTVAPADDREFYIFRMSLK